MLITGIGKDEMNGWIDGWMEYGIWNIGIWMDCANPV